jgi:hypothetical protein
VCFCILGLVTGSLCVCFSVFSIQLPGMQIAYFPLYIVIHNFSGLFREDVSDILSYMYIDHEVKYPSFLSDVNKSQISSRIFEESLST